MSDYDQQAYNLRKPLSVFLMSYEALLDLGRGTAFPTVGHDGAAVQAGARFFRTDLGLLCYYDGTRWLTVHEYVVQFTTAHYVQTAIGTALVGEVTFRQDFAPYFTRQTTEQVVAGRNNGTSCWTLAYRTMSTAGAVGTTLLTWNTSADTAAVVVFHDGTTVTTAATYGSVQLIATGTLAPGALTINGAVLFYRLIIV